jgi:serine/threonine protein kinase
MGASLKEEVLSSTQSKSKLGKLGKYQLLDTIHKGPSSRVYLTRHKLIDREFVLKVLVIDEEEDAVDKVQQEISALARLRHPNNVQVVDTGTAKVHGQPAPFIVLEYVEGETLRDLLNSRRRLSGLQTVRLTKQLLAGLSEAHGQGIVHRDIKPENLIIARHLGIGCMLKILDYGIADPIDQSQTLQAPTFSSGIKYGTPHYMPPETTKKASPTPQMDIYSVGVVMYECLAGTRPFDADEPIGVLYQHVHEDPPELTETAAVYPELAEIVEKALAKEPSDRFATTHEMLDALSALDPERLAQMSIPSASGNEPSDNEWFDTPEFGAEVDFDQTETDALRLTTDRLHSRDRPTIWILNDDPAVGKPDFTEAIEPLLQDYELKVFNAVEKGDELVEQLKSGELLPPWLVLFGDMHVILELELLAVLSEWSNACKLLVSTHLNAELFQTATQFCGVDYHIHLPSSTEDIRQGIETLIERTRARHRQQDALRVEVINARAELQRLSRKLSA